MGSWQSDRTTYMTGLLAEYVTRSKYYACRVRYETSSEYSNYLYNTLKLLTHRTSYSLSSHVSLQKPAPSQRLYASPDQLSKLERSLKNIPAQLSILARISWP
jgi:hypothetical protein